MIRKIVFFFGFLLGIGSPLQNFGDSFNERSFYAINSLQLHIKQLIKEFSHEEVESKILFEKADIEELWARAYNGPCLEAIERAKNLYSFGKRRKDLGALEKVQRLLGRIWKKSNDHFFQRVTVWQKSDNYGHYFLPNNHWLKGAMEKIFSPFNPIEKISYLKKAGFHVVSKRANPLYVVGHKKLPGYLVKLYLNSESKGKELSAKWLINRCLGAENVRSLIQMKKMKYFTVPDKWIYILPGHGELNDNNNAVLIVTDMNISSDEGTKWAWKNKITRRHLDELFCILSHGFSSTYLVGNIPYSNNGAFACLDTEHPKRLLPLNKVSSYLSPKMRAYWEKLVRKGGKGITK